MNKIRRDSEDRKKQIEFLEMKISDMKKYIGWN